MTLDSYPEPKGAYYTPALVATYDDDRAAEEAVASLRAAGFSQRDISVARSADRVSLIVSEPTPGMMEQARALLAASNATRVEPYGSDSDQV